MQLSVTATISTDPNEFMNTNVTDLHRVKNAIVLLKTPTMFMCFSAALSSMPPATCVKPNWILIFPFPIFSLGRYPCLKEIAAEV